MSLSLLVSNFLLIPFCRNKFFAISPFFYFFYAIQVPIDITSCMVEYNSLPSSVFRQYRICLRLKNISNGSNILIAYMWIIICLHFCLMQAREIYLTRLIINHK